MQLCGRVVHRLETQDYSLHLTELQRREDACNWKCWLPKIKNPTQRLRVKEKCVRQKGHREQQQKINNMKGSLQLAQHSLSTCRSRHPKNQAV
jgi:hypothetical protein